MKSIPIPGPQKRLIELKAGYKLSQIKANPEDVLKVRYALKPEEQADWLAIKDKIREQFIAKGFAAPLIQPERTKVKERSVNIRQAAVKSDKQLVAEFGAQRKLAPALLKAGMAFVEKA
jgi:hypothetical protein